MTEAVVQVRPDTYVDSVLLMAATRAMEGAPGVEWAAALMGTPANLETLKDEGFAASDLEGAGANDAILAVRAASREQCEQALSLADSALGRETQAAPAAREQRAPRSIHEAMAALSADKKSETSGPDAHTGVSAGVAIISVPGAYAALEAHKALDAGLHVLLFSDNVPLADEVALKARAQDLHLLVMGPGAGTAMLGGVGLGFANVVGRGRVGVAAAAGTGAQEVMSLLHRWGAGVSHVIGVGGRDLSEDVGGRMMRLAIEALQADAGTEVVLVVSKPPAPGVARALLDGVGGEKPVVAALIGLQERFSVPPNVVLAGTMEEAVLASLHALGLPSPRTTEGLAETIARAAAVLPAERRAVRGLFSGGTLCYEAMHILARALGPIYSNTPLHRDWSLPAPLGAHICLDLGEEEYTRGRPHPMIDPQARVELIGQEGGDPATAVLLLEIVLGYGAHRDPASVLAPACAEVLSQPDGPVIVVYVLGTERDPQGYEHQRRQLLEAGCLLAPTATRAASMAVALASRRVALIEEPYVSSR